MRQLAPFLVDAGWDVTVYGREKSVRRDDPTRDRRVRSVFTRGVESKSASTLSFGLTSVLHAMWRKPSVALVMNVANGYWLPLLRLRGIPTVVNVDGIEWEREKWNRLGRAVFKLGARMTARFAKVIVCDSIEIARRWREEFGRESVIIAYGGTFRPRSALPPLGLPSRRYVLFVARFVPENSVQQFLEAVPAIAKQADVVIVGSSGYGGVVDEQVQALSAANPRVHALGQVSDDDLLFGLWEHAGVYFHGHSVGGTNPALVQAMACGAPTVARDTVFNREVLAEHAEFVQPNANEIQEAVLALLSNVGRAEVLSRGAQERAHKEYSWEKINHSYETTLREASRRQS